MRESGFFIVIEGVDGAGKDTQVGMLRESLVQIQYSKPIFFNDVVSTCEPGGTSFGKKLRELILQCGDLDPGAELSAMVTDRINHVAQIIKPALEKKKIVVSNRYYHSTVAYQLYGNGFLPNASIDSVQASDLGCCGVYPDIAFILDLDYRGMVDRVMNRGLTLSKFEKRGQGYYEKVIAGYRSFLGTHGTTDTFCSSNIFIDAKQTPDKINRIITDICAGKITEQLLTFPNSLSVEV